MQRYSTLNGRPIIGCRDGDGIVVSNGIVEGIGDLLVISNGAVSRLELTRLADFTG